MKRAFNKYSKVRSARGFTGAEAAQAPLRGAGITDVRIVRAHGVLSDHYNPVTKTLALSEQVYGSDSIAAVGVATHEAGHAIQHARHYAPLWVRSTLVPTANIGSSIGYFVMLIGMFMSSTNMVLIGAVLFSAVLLFQIVTLPVEFNASGSDRRHFTRILRDGACFVDHDAAHAVLSSRTPPCLLFPPTEPRRSSLSTASSPCRNVKVSTGS